MNCSLLKLKCFHVVAAKENLRNFFYMRSGDGVLRRLLSSVSSCVPSS